MLDEGDSARQFPALEVKKTLQGLFQIIYTAVIFPLKAGCAAFSVEITGQLLSFRPSKAIGEILAASERLEYRE
jgi:hypothetical protein